MIYIPIDLRKIIKMKGWEVQLPNPSFTPNLLFDPFFNGHSCPIFHDFQEKNAGW